MTKKDFRRIALGMKDTTEAAHMGHPDFRVNNRIFATLRGDPAIGMVVLPLDAQQMFVREHPEMFQPERGAWGRAGCTRVHLSAAGTEIVGEAITLAYRNIAARGPAASKRKRTSARVSTPAPGRRSRS